MKFCSVLLIVFLGVLIFQSYARISKTKLKAKAKTNNLYCTKDEFYQWNEAVGFRCTNDCECDRDRYCDFGCDRNCELDTGLCRNPGK